MLEGTRDKASVGFGAESQSSEQTPTCVHQQDHPKDFFLTVGHLLFLHSFPLILHPISFFLVKTIRGSCKQNKTPPRLLCQREPDSAQGGV